MNGWQRLWIVTIVTLGIIVTYNATDNFPTQNNISDRYQGKREFWNNCLPYKQAEIGIPTVAKNPVCASLTAYQIDAVSKKLMIEEQYELADMPRLQLLFVANKGAWWLGISVGLYALGLIVRWIRQGFGLRSDMPT